MSAVALDDKRLTSRANLPFLLFFALYTAGSIFLLMLGVASAVATAFPGIYDLFLSWGGSNDVLGLLSRATAMASRLSVGFVQTGIDYVLSVLNLGVGIFLVARRPWDWVARLLGVGMVGTAMAFNFQSHNFIAVISQAFRPLQHIVVYHFMLHAVSGAAYVHAFLLFPNGQLVPRRLRWLLVVIYLIMIEEIAFPVLKDVFGTALFLSPAPPTRRTIHLRLFCSTF